MKDEAAQYQRLLDNRRRRGPRLVSEPIPRAGRGSAQAAGACSPIAAVLKAAARRLRRREQAAEAWARVAPPAVLAHAAVDSVERDVVVIRVSTATLCYDLSRAQAQWERQLGRLIPGICRIRFTAGGGPDSVVAELGPVD